MAGIVEKFQRLVLCRKWRLFPYKAEEHGIKVRAVDEAYTSQMCSVCSSVDKYSRKYRGLYVCKHCGTVLNADNDGAKNILFRIVLSACKGHRDSGFGHPRRIRVLQAPNFV